MEKRTQTGGRWAGMPTPGTAHHLGRSLQACELRVCGRPACRGDACLQHPLLTCRPSPSWKTDTQGSVPQQVCATLNARAASRGGGESAPPHPGPQPSLEPMPAGRPHPAQHTHTHIHACMHTPMHAHARPWGSRSAPGSSSNTPQLALASAQWWTRAGSVPPGRAHSSLS